MKKRQLIVPGPDSTLELTDLWWNNSGSSTRRRFTRVRVCSRSIVTAKDLPSDLAFERDEECDSSTKEHPTDSMEATG